MQNLINVPISGLRFAEKNEKLKTILGSCVSVVMYPNINSNIQYVASMSHYLLAEPGNRMTYIKTPDKYGTLLLQKQLDKMMKYGLDATQLCAKIAGGADMFASKERSILPDVGEANIIVAVSFLRKNKISIISKDVGGIVGRSILFDVNTKELKVTKNGKDTVII